MLCNFSEIRICQKRAGLLLHVPRKLNLETMKLFLYNIFCLLILSGCYYKPTKFPEQTKLPDGFYTAGNGWDLVFLKLSNDSVYADFIHMEKFPRELHSDTLQYDAASQTWKSNKGALTRKGAYYSITTKYTCETCTTPLPVTINQKIKKDKKLTQAHIDSYKNYAYLNMQHVIEIKKDSLKRVKAKFYEINERPLFLDSIHLMSHPQFLISYKKYQEEIEKQKKDTRP